jgi:hypothetical protein
MSVVRCLQIPWAYSHAFCDASFLLPEAGLESFSVYFPGPQFDNQSTI